MDELAFILALENDLTAEDIASAEESADNAAASAEAAAASASLAQQHSIGFEDGGTGLILKPIEEA